MKAIQYTAYGNSDVVQLTETATPAPAANEVLVRIHATTVNPLDMKIREGYLKAQMPITFPYIPGEDASGIVEAIGSGVTNFKIGDKVFACRFGGTYAEYAVFQEDTIALIPNNVNLDEAAALAMPLITAYSVLVANGAIKAGQKLVIHGAAGAVGQVMVQMAKALDVYVIATASGDGVELVKSLGANEVIDYKTDDFSQLIKDADLVADLVGGETQAKSFGIIKQGGLLLSIVMPPSQEAAAEHGLTAKFINSTFSTQAFEYGRQLVEAGKIKASITQTLPLTDAAKAQDLVSAGGIRGKILLKP